MSEELSEKLALLPDIVCDCKICKLMCQRPCWGTPEEIENLIDLGFGERMMLDFWYGNAKTKFEDIEIICPALKHFEGKLSPSVIPRSQFGCTFWDEDEKCQLHEKGLKPSEGRKAACSDRTEELDMSLHEMVARIWNSEKGRSLVEKWKKLHFTQEPSEDT